jgi:hypothetical protein
MRIIVAGTIGRSGLGGQAWAVLQYLLGFRALGHDVYYLEDCGRSSWVYVWEKEDWTHELDYPAAFVNACLEPFGFGDRWIYRDNYDSRGMPLDQFVAICGGADLLMMRAAPLWTWREEYAQPDRRVFVDVDPGFTQITLANGDQGWIEGVSKAERRFTFGRRIGESDCLIPLAGGPWLKTVPPVYLPEWPMSSAEATRFTSVIRWQGFKEVTHDGIAYGQRDQEFPRFLELPRATPQKFCIAQMGMKPELLTSHGWETVPGEVISRTPALYREFIQESRGEFSVPKNGYVRMRGGWFSDRSVCYLSSGRPVLIEDTGLRDWLPTGEGLMVFRAVADAVAAIDAVNGDYTRHRQAARRIAEEIFSTERVLPSFLEAAMS